MSEYVVTYKIVETDASTTATISVEADLIELAGGVLALSRKLIGGEKAAAREAYAAIEDPEAAAQATYTEIVFLMPLHRVIYVEKKTKLASNNFVH